MMVINGDDLLMASPIRDMLDTKTRYQGVSHGLAEVGYDIRLKQEVTFDPHLNVVTVRDPAGPSQTRHGRFTIASAMEEFDMPNDLVGIVHDKSTWARRGLSVFNTVIEPGWKGFLTLELVYHGSGKLLIPAGSGIAQVVFHRTSCPATYEGKYQNQGDLPVEAIAA
jgi:dCTP deaminase